MTGRFRPGLAALVVLACAGHLGAGAATGAGTDAAAGATRAADDAPPGPRSPSFLPRGVYWAGEHTFNDIPDPKARWQRIERALDDLAAHHVNAVWLTHLSAGETAEFARRAARRGIHLVASLGELAGEVPHIRKGDHKALIERTLKAWGDAGQGKGQTIWLADLSVALGGPVNVPPVIEADPYDAKAVAADRATNRPVTVYTKANAPATPRLEDLPLKESVSQYGMTWTFEKPSRVGQFVNGDWYVVGPATVTAIDPKPLYGDEIPKRELDHMDRERKVEHRVRNGFMLNPPAAMTVAYDSGVRNWFDASLIQKLPVAMKPGDSLVSTISMPKNLVLRAQLRNKIERGVDDSSPIRTAAVLTCVAEPQPADAFRPGFCDRKATIYLARNLKRELLPSAAASRNVPKKLDLFIRFTQRPWVGTCFFGFEEPVENMPQYGMEYGRVSGVCALLLCTDFKPEQKEPLLANYVQIGIDLGGMVRAGHPGWTGWGGHGSGRKLPIVFAGLLLGDEELANVNRSFPKVSFGEDEQTAYGDCWTGAKVVFAGHSGIDAATGAGRSRNSGWGPYEHVPPSQWKGGHNTSEAYRRTCTSGGWVAQGLALRLLHAEKAWGHDAFLDYEDRWMFEDDTAFIRTIKEATGKDYDKEWSRHGWAWQEREAFVKEMWAKHRAGAGMPPTDGWKRKHDDTYYRTAIERMR